MRDNPNDGYDKKVLNLLAMGRVFNICRIVDLFILIGGERLVGREASDRGPEHPMKQEITRFILFYVPATDLHLDLVKSTVYSTWRSPSSTYIQY